MSPRRDLSFAEPALPSLGMVRQLTDRRVFEQLLETGGLTRAAVAARTGISKPTISESVRRLIEAGVVVEDGAPPAGRGRAGTCCRLRTDTAVALAISVGPAGVVADTFDLLDRPVAHAAHALPTPVVGAQLTPVLLSTVAAAVLDSPGSVRSCVVSVAGPVERRTGQLVALAHAPFLVGDFSAADVLHDVGPRVEVDNDVNWAALAELRHGNAADLQDFVLCHLGTGVGGAVVVDGRVLHGATGMAGELAHVRTTAAGGHSRTVVEVLADEDLFVAGTEAVDVPRVRRVLEGRTATDRRQSDRIAAAVAGALDSVVALLDPDGLLLGGPWGTSPGLLERVTGQMAPSPGRELVLRSASLTEAPERDGVRARAVAAARQAVADDF